MQAADFYERVTGTVCQPKYPTNYNHGYPVDSNVGAEAQNLDSSSNAHWICPVPDKTDIPIEDITTIKLLVYDGNNDGTTTVYQVWAKACAFTPSGGATCSSSTSKTMGTGYQPLTLSGTQLNPLDADKTPYLYVSLPASDSGVNSGIAGLYFYRPSP